MIKVASIPAAFKRNVLSAFDVSPSRDAPMRRVVVPLDGSPASEAIVPIVARLARTVRCEIVILHAVGAVPYGRGADHALYMQATAAQTALAYLATVADRLTGDGFSRVRRSVWYKDPVSAINTATTTDEQVDLIAMASDGWPGLRRAGSEGIATAVTRATALPVLLARGSRWLGALDHVVVPLDGSPTAATILPVVSAIYEPGRTRIHLAYVAGPVRGLAPRDAALYLSNVATRLWDQGLMVDSTVTLDQAPGAIARFATRVDADLITMATDGEARSCSTRVEFDTMSGSPIPALLLRPGRGLEHRHHCLQPSETMSDGKVSVVSVARLDNTAPNLRYGYA
jgi:nucleotide-binding universal stress UspA family protein